MREMFLQEALRVESATPLLGILQLADEEAYKHSVSVAKMVDECVCIALESGELEWSALQCRDIVLGALLHDIGKAFLPFGLQHSASGLTSCELEIIRIHPLLGYVSIKNCSFSDIVKDVVLMHHANADGTGYPALDGKHFDAGNVPDYVWLVSYADRFEAMTNERSFKQAKSYPQAWKEMLLMTQEGILPYKYTRLFGEMIRRNSILPIKERVAGGDEEECYEK